MKKNEQVFMYLFQLEINIKQNIEIKQISISLFITS